MIVTAAPRHPTVTNMQAQFRPDDPQLVGRLVSLDAKVPTYDGKPVGCEGATVTRTKVTATRLLREMFPDRQSYGRLHRSSPADFKLSLAPGAVLIPMRLYCPAARGPRTTYLRAVAFPLGRGRWAFWRGDAGDHLLLLRPATGPIRASFDCRAARSASERAICSDRSLAGWDRSVAAAYDEGGGNHAEQRAWLTERDRCGADKQCLHESMSLRTDNLLR